MRLESARETAFVATPAGAEPDSHFLHVTFLFARPVRARVASADCPPMGASMMNAALQTFETGRWRRAYPAMCGWSANSRNLAFESCTLMLSLHLFTKINVFLCAALELKAVRLLVMGSMEGLEDLPRMGRLPQRRLWDRTQEVRRRRRRSRITTVAIHRSLQSCPRS